MKFPIRYIPLAALLLPAGLAAQTQQPDTALTRTVVVEQEYAPLIQDASKVNVLPRVEEPVVTPKNVEYDTAPVAATQIPADTLPSYAAKESPDKATPGYVRLGYGNLGNLDVYADYLFRLSDRDRLGLTVGVQGMDGELEDLVTWDAYDYRTRAALDYTHRFSRVDQPRGPEPGRTLRPAQLQPPAGLRVGQAEVHFGRRPPGAGLYG